MHLIQTVMRFSQMLVQAKFPPLGLHPKSQDVLLALPLERQPIKVSLYVYFSGRLSVSACVYGSLLHRFDYWS